MEFQYYISFFNNLAVQFVFIAGTQLSTIFTVIETDNNQYGYGFSETVLYKHLLYIY